ncbi:hypothetical protein QTO34_008082 [Cnephaeus nilssonii]|uniref:Uncharacterized protein n=1 Tax=Cnephaeus nilssonii TaxID=3371016 RepID=A0AA40IAW6_CNENI|nr:hypothetical protein QTO34_008082 [Eptesicus nilssonii]
MGQGGSPRCEPEWDDSEDGRARLERYRLAFLQGLRAGAKKPTDMAKTSEDGKSPLSKLPGTILLPHQCQLGSHQVVHEFLYLPDCSVPLMGRDLLAKWEQKSPLPRRLSKTAFR